VAQLTLYLFWIFFAGLIYYLLRENKREGYPLESERSTSITVQGWPAVPTPKSFTWQHGGAHVSAPSARLSQRPLAAETTGTWAGAPLVPSGNPMLDGVGPGSYAERDDIADLTFEGLPRIVPLRADPSFSPARQDPDPRGKPVLGADGVVGGTVRDLWVDRAEVLFRYLEVEVGSGAAMRRVLLPVNFSRIGDGAVRVRSILGAQFAQVPATQSPEQVTRLEEDKIAAYYGGGTLYATQDRQEPLL
jgi:photosynthetic reaction center H subunit